MQIERWTNQNHPQTLQIGVFLLYFDAVFTLLFDTARYGVLALVLALGAAGAGVGIANNKRVAWIVGIAVSAISILLLLNRVGGAVLSIGALIGFVFPIAQLVALAHPMSRNYTKLYFES